MTKDEISILIESVPLYTYQDVTHICETFRWVSESDFKRVIDRLTRWNKVEDKLPKVDKVDNKNLFAVKFLDGHFEIAKYDKYDFIDQFDSHAFQGITEWRYII